MLPAGTVTVLNDSFATPGVSLNTFTTTPPVGAVAFNVTVAIDVAPPVTLGGLRLTDDIAGGLTVRAADCCTLLYVAEIVDAVWAPTVTVVAANVVEVAFAGTVTLAGTVAAVDVLPNVTSAPPVGAGPFSVTVAIGFVEPPCTVVALNVSVAIPVAAGITVSVAL
jgi:hypothetical protein